MPKPPALAPPLSARSREDYKEALLALKQARHASAARRAVVENPGLTADQKIDVLYTAYTEQRQHQPLTNLFWSIVGAIIGLALTLAANLLLAHHL